MSPEEQRAEALQAANVRRVEVSQWKRRLKRNPHAVRMALATRPAEIAHVPLVEMLAWARVGGLRSVAMEELGRQAALDGVNLLVPLGRASVKTRSWAVEHGLRRVHALRSDAKVAA